MLVLASQFQRGRTKSEKKNVPRANESGIEHRREDGAHVQVGPRFPRTPPAASLTCASGNVAWLQNRRHESIYDSSNI